MASPARPIIFGELLFDCFSDGSRVLGGAPFNVAWHCQAFGLAPLLISRVGEDALGDGVASAMELWGMERSGLQRDREHPTGVVNVTLQDGEPAYEIVDHAAWDFIAADEVPDNLACSLLYHGSLALRHEPSALALGRLKTRCAAATFVDINLRPPWWNTERIEASIAACTWLKLNAQELALVAPQAASTDARVDALLRQGSIEALVVTQGEQGAQLATASGERLRAPAQPAAAVVDTVGAGDAFSSVLILGKLHGWPLLQTLQRAQQFASAVVEMRGATCSDRAFYRPFLEQWALSSRS